MPKSALAERPETGAKSPIDRSRRQRDDQKLMRRHKRGDGAPRDGLVAYGAVQLTGTNVNTIFSNIADKLGTAAGAGAPAN